MDKVVLLHYGQLPDQSLSSPSGDSFLGSETRLVVTCSDLHHLAHHQLSCQSAYTTRQEPVR